MGIIDLPELMFGYEAAGIIRCAGPWSDETPRGRLGCTDRCEHFFDGC
jgi:hypothetical protein